MTKKKDRVIRVIKVISPTTLEEIRQLNKLQCVLCGEKAYTLFHTEPYCKEHFIIQQEKEDELR